jgi:CRP-like cAMP-binding protein
MDELSPIEDRLAAVPLFSGLSRKQLGQVAALATSLEVSEGTVLTREGESGHEFLVVLEGEVEVRRGDRVIATRGPGSYLGEVALVRRRPRIATVVARTAASLQVFDRSEFWSLLEKFPELAVPMLSTIAEWLTDLDDESAA